MLIRVVGLSKLSLFARLRHLDASGVSGIDRPGVEFNLAV